MFRENVVKESFRGIDSRKGMVKLITLLPIGEKMSRHTLTHLQLG